MAFSTKRTGMTATYDLTSTAPVVEIVREDRKFPAVPYALASTYCSDYLAQLQRAAASVDPAEVDRAAEVLTGAYVRGSTVFSCGNGGSASIANHLQCDHLKGVRTGTDLVPKVVSLSSNVEVMTAIANDISYDDVFSYQLESQSRPDDVLVAISSSGRSRNIVNAIEWASLHAVRTIALTGFDGGRVRELAEVPLHVPCHNYGVVEDVHQALMHALAQYVRQSRMTPATLESTTF
jgi:phosphoheptose isomerase